ncbi:MAG: hypothetical protein IT168_09760 [Bryobacterales bacterium]|nr:hypothetical protein [Bryobacterales bacterium]
MKKRLYAITRDLHLYIGLFLSPFVLVFALSVFYLGHSLTGPNVTPETRTVTDVHSPPGIEALNGRELVDALQPVLGSIGVTGEINFVRKLTREHRIVVPVMLPGKDITVDLNLQARTATVFKESTGFADALIHLHKMPGPHNVNVRGNSLYMKIWRALADVTSYGILFLTLSGIYLWTVLRAERRVGLVLLSAGCVSFFGAVYAICR